MARPIHQLVPNLALGDAISQQAITLRRLLRGLGHASEIYAEHVDGRIAGQARPHRRLLEEIEPDAVVLFHFSIGSEVTDVYRLLANPRVLVYHNVTPPEYFRGVNERVAEDCRRGREELARLASSCRLALADSEFNRAELEALGYPATAVLPIALDESRFRTRPVRRIERPYRDGHVNFLHVGRLVPNKRIEDVLKAFYFYRRKINPSSRLFLVGIDTDTEVYAFALRELVRDLGIPGVVFTGGVSERELASYYRIAHVYLCMSEHEGFCAPLIEAMHFGVPVVAYAAGAVPETVGGAGVLVTRKRFPEIAELLAILCEDTAVRSRLIEAGRARARELTAGAVESRLRGLVEAL
ncbi:MAG: hypothetical protein QOD06_1893 [Candidatus Binatota bacterium]|jgi:glycosyltransferase involved in cell wall biosynthesis|nr:hypothetical protein [Candidatus Binatota bacterium]